MAGTAEKPRRMQRKNQEPQSVEPRKRRISRVPQHPYDTNDYEDLPDDVRIDIRVSFRNRIQAVCLDVHHCTIANALFDDAASAGIIELGRRGVSKSFVAMRLDPKKYLWADPDVWYRGVLDRKSADIVTELDALTHTPAVQKAQARALKSTCKNIPGGQDATWAIVTITAPPPSKKKGYRAGIGRDGHGHTGTGTKVRRSIPPRQWKKEARTLQE